ncbi:MAG TPA: hypothetical protein VHA37_00770 [Candidatus Saccharimonadales bacterium]|nr:hypothetical protein [Candidatus Saccharimonadales bacterium]
MLACQAGSGGPSFAMVPKVPVPANGWRFYNAGMPGTQSYALSNAAEGVAVNLCVAGSALALNRPTLLSSAPPGLAMPSLLAMPGPNPLLVGDGMLQYIAAN